MRCCGRLVGVTQAAEHAEGTIVRVGLVEAVIGNVEIYGLGGPYINKVCCRSCRFGPVGWRHGRLKEERASNIIDRADGALGFAVLGGGVRAGEAKANAVGREVGGDGGVEKLSPVVGLHGNEGQ
jgi:hypothetical protein